MSPFIVTSLEQNGSVFIIDTDDIDAINGSQGYAGNQVVGTLDSVDAADPYMNGARYRNDGALRLYDATSALPSGVYYDNGIAFTSSGQMCITQDAMSNPIYINGMAVRQDGAVYATVASFYLPLPDKGNGEVDLTAWGTGSSQAPTFTRATTATTVDRNGLIVPVSSGIARSYYDPTTLQYRGYLAEGARTNLCLQSNGFDTTWFNLRSSEAYTGGVTSPDGVTSSWKIVEDGTAANSHVIVQNITIATATTYTFSVFLKAGERGFARFLVGDTSGNNSVNAYVNLSTGEITLGGTSGAGWTYIGASAQSFGNGWWRVSITGKSAVSTSGVVIIYLATASGTIVYNGDGVSGIYVFGAQLEAGTFPSTYIPTTASAVTRNADVLTYPFSGNADATVGTAYAELGTFWSAGPSNQTAIAFGANGWPLYLGATASTAIRIFDGTNSPSKTGLSAMVTGSRKRASSWGGSTLLITGDGQTPASGTFDGDFNASASFGIGTVPAGGAQWFGPIKNVRIWKNQFTAAQLQAITSG